MSQQWQLFNNDYHFQNRATLLSLVYILSKGFVDIVWIVVTEIWNAKLDVFTTTTTATIDAITMCTVHIILYLEENESNWMACDRAGDWNPALGTDI